MEMTIFYAWLYFRFIFLFIFSYITLQGYPIKSKAYILYLSLNSYSIKKYFTKNNLGKQRTVRTPYIVHNNHK